MDFMNCSVPCRCSSSYSRPLQTSLLWCKPSNFSYSSNSSNNYTHSNNSSSSSRTHCRDWTPKVLTARRPRQLKLKKPNWKLRNYPPSPTREQGQTAASPHRVRLPGKSGHRYCFLCGVFSSVCRFQYLNVMLQHLKLQLLHSSFITLHQMQ